jgi:ubiquinol-cytochrome c reductase iron-sulfur subunit
MDTTPTCAALAHSAAEPTPEHDAERRRMLAVTAAATGVGALATAWPLVSSLAPSERARAQGASVEVELSDIAPGTLKTVEWRGKPVWVMRRTPEMLASLKAVEAQVVDPHSERPQQPGYAKNDQRSIKPELLVVTAICTHLGCSPTSVPAGSHNPSVPADWKGGFFCPCHGSTFDLAGRVFKNKPAPTNLEIPPHHYLSDTRLLVGEDGGQA